MGAFARRCQGGRAATRLTADQLHSGSNPDLGLRLGAHKSGRSWRKSAKPIFDQGRRHKAAARVTVHLSGDSGHSSRETPGPIPNPAVKPTHVVCGTEVRESPGTIPRCYHLPFVLRISVKGL